MGKQTTIRFDERMLENMEVIRKNVLIDEGIKLSNSDCVRKALEFLRKEIDSKKKKM